MNFSFFRKNEDGKRRLLPTKTMLSIRLIVGGYLMYLAYQLYTEQNTSMEHWKILMFCIFFVVAGAGIIGLTLYMYFNGMYEGGKADVQIEEAPQTEADAWNEDHRMQADTTLKAEEVIDVEPLPDADNAPDADATQFSE